MSDQVVSVFLVDDHAVIRSGLRALLDATGRICVVGEAGTAAEALPRVAATQPSVVVIDVQLPDGPGYELCAAIRAAHPETACLMLTSFADDDALFGSIRAGAAGFLLKQVRTEGLVSAIELVAAGGSLVDPAVTERLLDRIRHPVPDMDPRLKTLTPHELAILKHMAAGLTNREIAPRVNLAEATVKNYVSTILRKLGFSRRTEAAVFALKSGVLDL
ncbi:MAG: hypothetical protein RI958_203 [Actinomycetota bacterium]|jgi:DNA-binding NarL/FixJ family response regulator